MALRSHRIYFISFIETVDACVTRCGTIDSMKLISWNVNGIRAWSKKGGLDWFLNENPDFFCVQETKAHPDQLDEGLRDPMGYFSYFDHSKTRKGYSGVAIYTKHEPVRVTYGLGIPELDQEGRMITLFYDKWVFINTYYPNGGGGPERLAYKLKFYDAFLEYIEKLKKKGYNVVFTGDINTAHNAIDLARPKENEKNTGFLPEERAWIDQVVSAGYLDTFRYLHPDTTDAYSYWDMKTRARDRNVGWRIDYFFVSKDLEKKIISAGIRPEVFGSDHCPIYLEIEL